MVYTIDKINKVLGYKTWSDIKKIDELFKFDCDMHCNLGNNWHKVGYTAYTNNGFQYN